MLLVLLASSFEVLRELLIRGLGEGSDFPEIRREELVGVGESVEGSLDEVTLCLGVTSRRGVDISNTGEGDHLLRSWGTDNGGTSGSWDKLHSNGSTLTGDLHWDGVRKSELVTPVASSNWNQGQLCGDDTTLNSVGNFLGGLNTETNVSVFVTDGDEGLEAGSLTGRGLLLDGHNLHDLLLERTRGEEMIDDLILLNGETMKIHLLERLNLAISNQTAQLSDGDPSLGFLASAALTLSFALTLTLSLSETLSESALSFLNFSHLRKFVGLE